MNKWQWWPGGPRNGDCKAGEGAHFPHPVILIFKGSLLLLQPKHSEFFQLSSIGAWYLVSGAFSNWQASWSDALVVNVPIRMWHLELNTAQGADVA